MKILMVNKFLYRRGGAETYMLELGRYLEEQGHEVQYFGMDCDDRCVGNDINQYVSTMELRGGNKLKEITYPFKIIYSFEAKRKIAKVLDKFKPDIVHMNNINLQLTPAIIYEVKKRGIPIVQTVHDTQMICPNHRLYVESSRKICEKCIDGKYMNSVKEKCVQNSSIKSFIAAVESYYYHWRNTYDLIDYFICPSKFIAEKIGEGGIGKNKTIVMCNFANKIKDIPKVETKERYVLYFGRLSEEKGIYMLIDACEKLSDIKFVIAGSGPLEDKVKQINRANVEYVGFKTGKELQKLIANASFSVYPSEWYENCPLSVIESQTLGTPVLCSDLGGTKELIINGKTGQTFKGGDNSQFEDMIQKLWNSPELLKSMSEECLKKKVDTIDVYYKKVIDLYETLIEDKKTVV